MKNQVPLSHEQQIREQVRIVLNRILDEEYDILLEKLKDNPDYLMEKRADNLFKKPNTGSTLSNLS